MSKATTQTIANVPKVHKTGVCDALLPSYEASNTRAGNCRSHWGLHVCSTPAVPAACPGGSRYSLLFQGLIQRGNEGQQNSRLRQVQRAHCPDTVFQAKKHDLRTASCLLSPRSTAMHTNSIGDIPDQEYLYHLHREILVQRVLVACPVRLEAKERG